MTNPLRRPVFAWFFAGRLTSLLGSSMAPVALAFAVLDASNSPNALGIVLAANLVPHLLLLLVGGATADRLPRRTVLVAANLGSALTQGAVAAILLTGNYSFPLIAGLEFGNGVVAAFTTPALRGVVPELVDVHQLQKANALLGSTRNATKIIGPTVAGVLVAAVGSGPAIAFDAATFAVAAVCLLRLGGGAPSPTQRTALLRDIRQGWSYFRSVCWLWPVSLTFFVVNLVQAGPWQILGPDLMSRDGGPRGWGLVLSARAVGLLAMSMLMYRLVVRYYLRVTLVASVVAAVPLLGLGIGLNTPYLIVAAIIGGIWLIRVGDQLGHRAASKHPAGQPVTGRLDRRSAVVCSNPRQPTRGRPARGSVRGPHHLPGIRPGLDGRHRGPATGPIRPQPATLATERVLGTGCQALKYRRQRPADLIFRAHRPARRPCRLEWTPATRRRYS